MIAITFQNKRHFACLRFGLVAVFMAFVFAACAPYQARRHPLDYKAVGEASWYGPGFHGRKTASGERYNQKALTAAHKTLPLGTSVQVTNLENDKSVIVRINDRGPFVRGRIIDLSKGAAEKLGMLGGGTAEVRIDAISAPAEGPEMKVALASKESKGRRKILPGNGEPADDDIDSGDLSSDKSGVAALIAREPQDDEAQYAMDVEEPAKGRAKKAARPAAPEKAEKNPVEVHDDQEF